MSATYLAGFNAKASLNSTAYAFVTYQVRDITPEADVTNSEGLAGNSTVAGTSIGDMAVIATISHFEATLRNATWDSTNNPFSAPISLKSGEYITFQLFPAGRGGPQWQSTSFYVRETSADGDVKMLQPISMSGISDSGYTLP